jgi:hypothetical protein
MRMREDGREASQVLMITDGWWFILRNPGIIMGEDGSLCSFETVTRDS